ncbi:MAG TPA: MFS transporter [Phycisphaerae bacterium]|nr:MFS transporter [Phycisphaerae bacterium]HRY68113.1 MFS transporter [Phycisphaerae bacterium]
MPSNNRESPPPSRDQPTSSGEPRLGPGRYLILAAAVVMQLCLGATYAWSIFVDALRAGTGMSQAAAQVPFTVFYMIFPATLIVSGMLLGRLGPRRCAIVGGLVFGGGWVFAGLGGVHSAFTVLGIGVLGGLGVGLAYIVPIATGMLWFPRNKGLVTGVAVAGFGGGAAIVSQTAEHFMSAGLSPFQAFVGFGLAFAALIVLAGSCMRNPPGHVACRTRLSAAGEFLRDRHFIMLYVAMFVGLAAGFIVSGNLKQMGAGSATATAALAVALFAVANAAGRVTWGTLFDRVGPTAIRINLATQAAVFLAAPWWLNSAAGLGFLALGAGFNYGGVLVLYASSVASHWGPERVGPVYGWLFSANIPASVAPIMAGLVFDRTNSFTIPLVAVGVLLAVTAGVLRAER